jgi:hypothetical protein
MNDASLSRDLCGFATELRQLAYAMSGGHEDPLVRLSEPMIHCAQEAATEHQPCKRA